MKTPLLKSGLFCLAVIGIMSSCSKSNVAQPSGKLSYQFKVTTATAPLVATSNKSGLTAMSVTTTAANVTWQSGYATVSSISFDGENENEGNQNEQDNFTEPAPFKLDLFNSNTILGNIDVLNGTYQNVGVKLELKQTAADSALYLAGVYNSSTGSTTPVTLSLDGKHDDFEILVKAKNLSVSANQSYLEFLDLHLDILLAGVTSADLDAATLTNGTIVINSVSNVNIYNKILANVDNFCDGEND